MIDPNFAPPGFVAVEAEFDAEAVLKGCAGCAFENCDADVCEAITENFAGCASDERPDEVDVIFVVRVATSQPATANFPYDDMGAPV